jgi:hypothetical protein
MLTCSAWRTFRESLEFAVFHNRKWGKGDDEGRKESPHFLKIMVYNYAMKTIVGTI